MSDSITCPNCRSEIPLTEAISHQVEERLRAEFSTERRDLETNQANALAERDAAHVAQLARVRAELAAAAEAAASEKVATELRDLATQVDEQATRRKAAEDRELALLRDKRILQEEHEALELKVERQIEEERQSLIAGATERLEEGYRLKLREKDVRLDQMTKRIDELQASAEQKRSGLQGEVLEREVEDVLCESFPADAITPVKSGKRGADVVQRIRSQRGLDCGSLLWESKNAKHWSNGWVEKLRSDQQDERADIAIIVTTALPDGVHRMAFHEGIFWVCDPASVVALATALRHQLAAIAQARVVDANRSRALDDVYDYLCGREFQHRVTNAVTAAMALQTDLDAERTAAERAFAKRQKQIQILLRNSAGMYGELQAIVGGALEPVAALELPPGEDEPLALAS